MRSSLLKIVVLTGFILMLSFAGITQEAQIDSLHLRLKKVSNDKERLEVINNLGLLLSRSFPDSALKYALIANKLARKLQDTIEIANNHKSLGNIYYTINELDSAIVQYKKSLEIYAKLKDTLGQAKIHNNIGALHRAKGNYASSMEHYQLSLDFRKLLNDRFGMGKTYNNIGNVHFSLNNLEKALSYYKQSLDIRLEYKDIHGAAGCYTNMGLIFTQKQQYDTAINLFERAIEIYKNENDLQGIAHSLTSLGLAYNKLNKVEIALSTFTAALELYQKIGNKRGVSMTYSQISTIYNHKKEFQNALIFANKALSVSNKYNTTVEKSDAFEQLAIAMAGLGRYKEAYDYKNKHKKLEDSLVNLEKVKEIEMIEQKYQNENQRLQIEKLETENKLNEIKLEKLNNRQIISIIGIIIALTFIVNLLRNRRKLKAKNRTIQDQNKKISKQKFEIERHRNHLEDLVEERTEDLIKAKERAEESDRLKSAFLTNMSHEIRTPMNAIMGFTELLNSTYPSEEERAQYRKFIETNSELLLRLMDDIIDIAKIESGQITVSLRPVSIDDIMEKVIPIFKRKRTQSDKETIEIIDEITKCEEKQIVNADPLRLQQILTNLIDNALKFTEKGYIKISCKKEKIGEVAYANIVVEDTGIGMSKEQLSIIFERFGKVEENTKKLYRGAGLGLTISKNLIELMGGDIMVESQEGKGTTFSFRIPAIEE
jgi:signal transduction histidine kinase/Tfp pilus assembly protein PilF